MSWLSETIRAIASENNHPKGNLKGAVSNEQSDRYERSIFIMGDGGQFEKSEKTQYEKELYGQVAPKPERRKPTEKELKKKNRF